MIIAVVLAANFYNGLNMSSWNWWVFGSVILGPVLILCYTAVYSAIAPGWFVTPVYGLNQLLWNSAAFWLGAVRRQSRCRS